MWMAMMSSGHKKGRVGAFEVIYFIARKSLEKSLRNHTFTDDRGAPDLRLVVDG